jgi:hypothetical protein
MSRVPKSVDKLSLYVLIRQESQLGAHGIDHIKAQNVNGVPDGSAYALASQRRKGIEHLIHGLPFSEFLENHLNCDPGSLDHRLAEHHVRFGDNSRDLHRVLLEPEAN